MSLFARILVLLVAVCAATPSYAEKIADLPYGPDKEQRMDVYLPEASVGKAPIIFMAHGGAWRRGDKDMSRVVEHKSAHYLKRGFIFISANYRMEDSVTPVDQAEDIVRAVAEIQRRAGEWGGDPSRMVLMGHSAGAHLVALVSVAPPTFKHPVRGSVLLDSGALDVPKIMGRKHFRFYDRAFGADPKLWELASPYHQMNEKFAPILVICSTRRDVSCEQGEAFVKKGRAIGTQMELLEQDMSHGQINYELGKPGIYTSRVDVFIDQVLR